MSAQDSIPAGRAEEAGLVAQTLGEDADIDDEERARGKLYALLGYLLAAPPATDDLARLQAIEGDESDLGRALSALAAAAGNSDAEALRDEYHALFIGVGRGELNPFASYYLTGFLQEKPLANLRLDMARLGIARTEDVPEPEDHIASLCEMMAGLILGAFGAPAGLAEQQRFFNAHIGPWAVRFFEDLETAETAVFYVPVGTVGKLFMTIESQAFEMAA